MKHKNNRNEVNNEKKTSPHKKTVDFLTQFARVYCSEKTFHAGPCNFVLN